MLSEGVQPWPQDTHVSLGLKGWDVYSQIHWEKTKNPDLGLVKLTLPNDGGFGKQKKNVAVRFLTMILEL